MEKNRNVRMGFKSRQAYSRTDVNLPNNSPIIFKGKMRLFTYYTSKVFSRRRNNQEMDISKQKEKKKNLNPTSPKYQGFVFDLYTYRPVSFLNVRL